MLEGYISREAAVKAANEWVGEDGWRERRCD